MTEPPDRAQWQGALPSRRLWADPSGPFKFKVRTGARACQWALSAVSVRVLTPLLSVQRRHWQRWHENRAPAAPQPESSEASASDAAAATGSAGACRRRDQLERQGARREKNASALHKKGVLSEGAHHGEQTWARIAAGRADLGRPAAPSIRVPGGLIMMM